MIAIIGIAAMITGLALTVAGAVVALREAERERGGDVRGPADELVDSLARLMEALADHPVGVRVSVLGIVVFFLGGLTAGVGALVG